VKSEIIYGIHPVHEALRANRRRIHEIYLAAGKKSGRLMEIQSLAVSRGIAVKAAEGKKIQALAASGEPQAVAARVSPYPAADLDQVLGPPPAPGAAPLLLVLDGIQDPRNLGAVIRTALCAGVDGIVIPRDRCASPTPAVSSASAGALEHIRLVRVTNLVRALEKLKRAGLWVAGLERRAPDGIYGRDLTLPLALVVGGEQKGIRLLVRKKCDWTMSIPQNGPLDSLNVSVAAAVVLYEAVRQRGGAGNPV